MPDPLDNAPERAKRFLRDDPFLDGGKNPFGDGGGSAASDRPVSANIFATSTDATAGAPRRDYVTTQEPRGAFLLQLGIVGLVSFGVELAAAIYSGYFPPGLSDLAIVSPLLSLAATIPSITLSYLDMLAMEAGAMSPTGLTAARIAFICGILGTLAVVGYVAVLGLIIAKVISIS